MLAVSAMLVEPKAVLVDAPLDALKRLLAVGIGFVNLNVSWLVEVVAFVLNPPLGVGEDVPNPEKLVALCEGPLSVEIVAFVPNPSLGVKDVPNPEKPVALSVEVVAFVPNPPLGVKDVPNPEKPVALCEGPLSVDVAAVPKTEPVVVEDEGCTAAVEMPVTVVSRTWMFEGERFVLNSPPVVEEDKDSAVPNE